MQKHALCEQKDAVQPAHPCSLISTFVVCCLDTGSIIPVLAKSKISILYLVSVAEQAGLSYLVAKPRREVFLLHGSTDIFILAKEEWEER